MVSTWVRCSRLSAHVAALGLGWVLVAGAAPASAPGSCAGDGPRLKIVVENVRSDSGEVVMELYPDDPKRFLAHAGRLERVRRKAERSVTSACIDVTTPGMYALALYHDENNDELFNRSIIGLPSEGFGFSNNAPVRLGPPSLSAVRFRVSEGETIVRVRLRYIGGRS